MTDEVREWLAKAEQDLRSAQREAGVDESPNRDLVLFLCQQSVEKLLKANLLVRGRVPPRIHDLAELSRRLATCTSSWQWSEDDLRWLTMGAVTYRYPMAGLEPLTGEDVARAVELAGKLRESLLRLLRAAG